MVVNKTRYLLILNVNGLLCATQNVRFGKRWKPVIPVVQCGNKLMSPRPNSLQFLKLCFSKFEIGIWLLITQPNLIPMFDFLLQDNLGLKPLLIWGNDKCDVT
jgi:hypothetical protein